MAEKFIKYDPRDAERRASTIHLESEIKRIINHQDRPGIPCIKHRIKGSTIHGVDQDLHSAGHLGKQWRQFNGGNRLSFTYSHYLAKQARDAVQDRYSDLERYARENYGVKRLYRYLLTINPASVETAYSKLEAVDAHVLPIVRNIGQVLATQRNMENAVVYRHNATGIGNDRHLHDVVITSRPINVRAVRDAKSKIKAVCRRYYGYGKTSVDFAPKAEAIAYATKGAGLFDPLKIDKRTGQDQYQKILSAERRNRRAGMVVLASEMNASHRIHRRGKLLINPRNVIARSWQHATESLKRYREALNDPEAKSVDCSMDLFTLGKRRKRRSSLESKHHATGIEALRVFNGLDRYTGKMLDRVRREVEAMNRRILARSRRIMNDLTNDGQKSLYGLKLPGLSYIPTPSEVLSGMVLTADTS